MAGMEVSFEEALECLQIYSNDVLRPIKPFPPRVARTLKYLIVQMYKEQKEIEQIAGRALGYPRYCDDQKNFPGNTEEDGVCIGEHVAASIVAELADSYVELKEYFKRGQG